MLPVMTDNATTLGQRLERQRQKVKGGPPSYRTLSRTLYDMLGEYAPTDESLRRIHVGLISPEKVDLVILAALCDVYGCTVKDVSKRAAERTKTASDLLSRQKRCTVQTPAFA